MNIDVYQTIACKGYKLDNIYKALKIELVTYDHIINLEEDEREIEGIKLLVGEANNISSFTHPIIVHDSEISYIVLDVRRFIKPKSSVLKDFMVSNRPEFNLLVLRAKTQYLALVGKGDYLIDFDPLPALIFSRWIANAIAFKMNFSPHDQIITTLISMAYYLRLFETKMDIDELKLFVNRNTYIDPDIISDIFESHDEYEKLNSVVELSELLKEKIGNIRAEKISVPLLLASLTYGWNGSNAKEVMAVCLEHPPTWIACLATAIKDKNYKHSPIAKIVKTYTKKNKGNEYLLRLEELISKLN